MLLDAPTVLLYEQTLTLRSCDGAASTTGAEVNQGRATINALKAAIQKTRLQTGVAGLGDGGAGDGAIMSPEETGYRQQLEGEKSHYKSKIAGLKSFKQEIEHLQHLLEMAKVKLHRDFEAWCIDPDAPGGASASTTIGNGPSFQEEFPKHLSTTEQRAQKAWGTPPLSPIGKPMHASASYLAYPPVAPATEAPAPPAPVDDDIEAFFKAREVMRNR
jgi:hypothetical protein